MKEIKYADDFNVWTTANSPSSIQQTLNVACTNISNWCSNWRMKINASKTKVMIFSKRNTPNININLDQQPLESVADKKILGIKIDNKLKFSQHFLDITSKAKRAANALTQLTNLNIKTCSNLYKMFCRSKLENGSIVWGYKSNKYGNRALLESAQHHGLRCILGATPSTSTMMMESEINVPPIDKRINELQRMEYIKIMKKDDQDPTKKLLTSKTSPTSSNQSPVDFLIRMGKQLEDRLLATFGTYELEPAPDISIYPLLIPGLSTHNMDANIGNANTRNKDQAEEGRFLVLNQLQHADNKSIIAYTDGSSLDNPGPTGSGAVILTEGPSSTPIKLAKAIDKRSNNMHGEIAAIDMAIEYATAHITPQHKDLFLVSDCRGAIQTITSLKPAHNYSTLINKIRSNLSIISKSGMAIKFIWTPAHANIQHNETADQLAKTAAKHAKNTSASRHTITLQEARILNRKITIDNWNSCWHTVSQHSPTVYNTKVKAVPAQLPTSLTVSDPILHRKMIRMRMDRTRLEAHKAIYSPNTSPVCENCNTTDDIHHLVFSCFKYASIRRNLLNICQIALARNPVATNTSISIDQLLGHVSLNASHSTQELIYNAFAVFIAKSKAPV